MQARRTGIKECAKERTNLNAHLCMNRILRLNGCVTIIIVNGNYEFLFLMLLSMRLFATSARMVHRILVFVCMVPKISLSPLSLSSSLSGNFWPVAVVEVVLMVFVIFCYACAFVVVTNIYICKICKRLFECPAKYQLNFEENFTIIAFAYAVHTFTHIVSNYYRRQTA